MVLPITSKGAMITSCGLWPTQRQCDDLIAFELIVHTLLQSEELKVRNTIGSPMMLHAVDHHHIDKTSMIITNRVN